MATEIKKIISRRDTAAKWEANNPILAQGEIGVDTTNKVMKIGDGVTPWKSLTGVGGVEIVNDLTTGGADKALSAEMGKQLNEQLTGDVILKDFEITEKDTDEYNYNRIVAPAGERGLIPFDVSDLEEFSLEVSVLTGSPIKCAIHRSLSMSDWSISTADSGWITAGQTVTKDNTFGSAVDGYLRLIITNNTGVGIPDISTILQYVTFKFSAQRESAAGGVLSRLEYLEAQGSEVAVEIENVKKLAENSYKKSVYLELDITEGTAINTSQGVNSSSSFELINYLDISIYNNVMVTTGLWISGGGEGYDTTVELYDSNKSLLKRYKARDLYGSAASAFAFVYSGSLPTDGASYIRFSNITSTPSNNTNSDFTPTEASVAGGGEIDSGDVYDEELGKQQNEINKELTSEIFGNSYDEIVDVITQSDLFDDKYLSTASGGGRGYYNIPIESYDRYSCVIAIASDSTVKAAITLSKMTSYGDAIYDSKWVTAGGTHSISEKTSTSTEVKYIQLRFTYSSGTGVPTLDEIEQYATIVFEGITLADRGLKGKIEELEKVVFPSSASGYSYQGEKVSFRDNGFTSEVIGNLSAGVSSRQGGAVFGDYLFQFHNTLETIVVYNLKTKTNVQTLTLTPISNHHAGSGGFGNEYYDDADMFPILYISSMYENRVYGYRIIGNTAGSWTIETVQTITIDKQGLYIPNIAIDRENNMVVVFGYTKNSWSDSNNNLSVITSFVLPKLSDGDVTVTEFSDERKIPFIYAEQGSFARLGKLYMSYGNTISKCGMYVIDYVSGIAVSHAPFEPLGTFEPEAFALYGENIIMTGQNGNIYKLSF